MTEVNHTRTAVVLGGTAGIGREVAQALARRGQKVYLSGRELARAEDVASEIGGDTHPLEVDLAEPHHIAGALVDVGATDDLVIGGIDRDSNTVIDYRIDAAVRLVTLKLVGYIEAVHALHKRLTPGASIVLFGGLALERPYPGSTTVSTVNGGVTGVVHTLATELGPIRVNAIHPGIVGDSPFWAGKDTSQVVARTPLGRLVTMAEIVQAVLFMLDCSGVNGVNLAVDGGWRLK
jgi:NAD(P)-dependent dehydrogenase (short-subunit alcohol dehydrogenase family)